MSDGFVDELTIERAEALIAAPLADHAAAIARAAIDGARLPPWPDALLDPGLARVDAAHDPAWAARAATVRRWHLAATVAHDRDVIDADRAPRTRVGLAARHQALAAAAGRRGLSRDALIARLYGVGPTVPSAIAPRPTDVAAPTSPLAAWPDAATAIAEHAGVDAGALTFTIGRYALTVATPSRVVCVAPAVHDLATLAIATHELGHGLYAAAMRGLPLGLAAPPSRVVDEAIAAWAVRQLEAVLSPAWAAVAAIRRARGEHLRACLAGFEATAMATGDVDAAWTAWCGDRDTARFPMLFDEPGAAAAYAAADRWTLAPAPGQLASWGRAGAAFDPGPVADQPGAALA